MTAFLALVRRELLERRGLFIAIAAFAAFVIAMTIFASAEIDMDELQANLEDSEVGYGLAVATGMPFFLLAFVLTFFHLTGSVHGERRDRSVYFYKSMPVGDTVTVITKLAIGVVLIPLACVGAMALTQVVAYVRLPAQMWPAADLPGLWLHSLVGYAVYVFWGLPVWGWLLLVSALAPRLPALISLSPVLLVMFGEYEAIAPLADFIVSHAAGAPLPGGAADIAESLALFHRADLYLGVIVGAGFIAGAIRARRVLNET